MIKLIANETVGMYAIIQSRNVYILLLLIYDIKIELVKITSNVL
jgi:hypothetical protein